MAKVRGEEGAALVTALLLTLLTLVIATALLYTVTLGSKSTASHKRYSTALAAAEGGVDVLAKEVVGALFRVMWDDRGAADPLRPKLAGSALFPLSEDGMNKIKTDFSALNLEFSGDGPQCLEQKLVMPTREWSACSANGKTSDPIVLPDATFSLQGSGTGKKYQVATKIVDTVPGNTCVGRVCDDAGLLPGDSVTAGFINDPTPQHIPYLYTLGVEAHGEGSAEKARISVLYAY